MTAASTILRSRATALAVLLLAAVGVLAALLPAAPEAAEASSRTGLGVDVESAAVQRLQEQLPGSGTETALVVWDRTDGGALTPEDLTGITEASAELADLAAGGRVPPPQPAPDGTVALVPVPLEVLQGGGTEAEDAAVARIDALRERLGEQAPEGLRAQVTGGPAFLADLGKVFEGADLRLLIATAGVVAVLLLLTYRSPGLVLVPLVVVGATEQVTLALADQVLPRLDLPGGGQVTGIASVLVFGAATDYALLLIARYREQLRLEASALAAMRVAVARTAEAILASGGTVLLALAVLLLASTEVLRAIAVACMIGVALAVLASLVVLPCALVLFGRRIFWPLVPRVGDPSTEGRLWGRLGALVAARPGRVLLVSTLVLAALALPVTGVRTGLSQNEQFRDPPEAVIAAERLAQALPAGATEPLAVLTTPDDLPAVVDAATAVDGVASAAPGPAGDAADGPVQVDVVLEDEPGSAAAREAVLALRTALDGAGSGTALVGGAAAERVDLAAADARDLRVVIPLVLLLVGLVLVVLLRSLLAPLLLVATVVASFAASLGGSWLLFDRVLGFPALDGSVVVLSFLFLVALGVDYNIFLTTRAREEARPAGTRAGMLTALTVTGGVITSAGLVLAAVFAVLGVLPLITLTQVGVIVCVGVLLDTLLVRTVVVPALAFGLGERFWWPGRPHQGRHSGHGRPPHELAGPGGAGAPRLTPPGPHRGSPQHPARTGR